MAKITWIVLISLMMSTASRAETIMSPLPSPSPSPSPTPKHRSQKIPQQPSAPPQLQPGHPPEAALNCQRKVSYRGKQLDCDSIMHRDGEGLRPIISTVPEAVAELDTYQKNRRAVKNAAYVGTAGLLLIITGTLLRSQANASIATRNRVGGAGIVLLGGSLIYGLTVLTTNESHLDNAVNRYNDVNPKDPITFEVNTQFHF